MRRADNETGMNGTSKPRIEFQPRFLFVEYETEIIRQAYLAYGKNIKRTAGFLDVSARKVKKALARLARSENQPTTQVAGDGASIPSNRAGDPPEEQ